MSWAIGGAPHVSALRDRLTYRYYFAGLESAISSEIVTN